MTQNQVISISGSSSIKVYSTSETDFPLVQTLLNAHELGCHHLASSKNGQVFASAGFGGEVRVWSLRDRKWEEKGMILGGSSPL